MSQSTLSSVPLLGALCVAAGLVAQTGCIYVPASSGGASTGLLEGPVASRLT
jgi:hypothetical protein